MTHPIDPTNKHAMEWTAYFAGALLSLLTKYALYLGENRKRWMAAKGFDSTAAMKKSDIHWSAKKATIEWFLENSSSNITSWVTTIGVVWIAGAAYLSNIDWLFGGWAQKIPAHPAIAFFLGSVMEGAAPAITKWAVAKLPLPKVNGN